MSDTEQEKMWYEDYLEEEIDYSFKEYEVTSSPNDFNVKTIFDFIESGVVKIPGFQRNYVWDDKRASKLIESLIIGLPIPQIFLYEQAKNSFLVIDGQQRLMTLYYFIKMRFPKKDKRIELRKIFNEEGFIPDKILYDNNYFEDFVLTLPNSKEYKNKLNKLNYATLGEYKTSLELRTIRNVIIKQNYPADDDSAMFEIFNRLNTGGINLKPQEIRVSLFHSNFYDMLIKLNLMDHWRTIINKSEPDLHMKDVEILLRSVAILLDSNEYRPSMTQFLNKFSQKAKGFKQEFIEYLEKLLIAFFKSTVTLGGDAFLSKNNKFNISAFEAIFNAMCCNALKMNDLIISVPTIQKLEALKSDAEFLRATLEGTASKKNVDSRIKIAKKILFNEQHSN